MATNGNDTIFFQGSLGQLTITLVNAYSGETISIDDEYNINTSSYDGLGGTDTLFMTNSGDALFIEDNFNNQVVQNVEVIIAGNGGDIIDLSSTTSTLGDLTIFGGAGDDILWGNIGNDSIFGASGNDIIDGGPGNDILNGESENDTISGGTGNDTLNGGTGTNVLIGGAGGDTYLASGGDDTIIESSSSDLNVIKLPTGITFGDLVFTVNGNDLDITVGASGTISIQGQFDAADSGIDTLVFSDTSTFDLRTISSDPVAQDDDFTIAENVTLNGNLFADNGNGVDSDPNGDPLSLTATVLPTVNGGLVILQTTGDFVYSPAFGFTGVDTFDYTVLDGNGGSDIGTVTITIGAAPNTDPVAQDDTFGGTEDQQMSGNVLADNGAGADSDADGDTLTVQAAMITTGNGGTVNLLADGSFTYTPAADFNGPDSFDYTVLDGNGGSDIGTATVNMVAVNDDPVAQDDSFNGTEDQQVAGNVLADNGNGVDSDVDGDTLTTQPAVINTVNGGVVNLLADGSFTYVPAADFNGPDSFDYTVLDGNGGSDVGTATINMAAVNDDPVAQDDDFGGTEDQQMSGNVLADNGNGLDSDVDGDVLTVQAAMITTVNGGTVNLLADGSFTYMPAADFNGPDSFDYTVLDGNGGSDVGTVTINMAAVNDDPVAQDDSFTMNEDQVMNNELLGDHGNGSDGDVEGDTLTVQAATFTTAMGGTVTILADGSFTYVPQADFAGIDTFDYTLLDGNGGSDVGTATIDILPVNDDPTAQDDTFGGTEDQQMGGNVLVDNGAGLDSDVDGDVLTVQAAMITTVSGGTVNLLVDGSFTYMPALNFNGPDSFDYTVLDGNGGSDIGTATINMVAVNDDPDAQGDSFTTNEDVALNGNVLADNGNGIDSDVDGDPLSVQPITLTTVAGGSVVIQANGDFDYTPLNGFFGADSFDYTLLDGAGGSDIGTVNITVNEAMPTNNDDVIYGTPEDDVIDALDGNDVVFGLDGNDELHGSEGNDTLYGDTDVMGVAGQEVIHEFSKTNPSGSDQAGDIHDVFFSYNEATNEFTFEVAIADNNGMIADGFTLAVNDGANPKNHAGEMALIYFDASEAGQPVVSVYGYNGLNGFSSFMDGDSAAGVQAPDQILTSLAPGHPFTEISSTINGAGETVFKIVMDASSIVDHVPLYGDPNDWSGVSFDDQIGVWLHPQAGIDSSYDANGFLTSWSMSKQSWYDTAFQDTTTVTVGTNDDSLYGGAGDDTLFGGEGSDLLDGGAGNDTLLYSQDEIWPSGFAAHNVGAPDAQINGETVTVNPRYRSHDGFNGGDGEDTLVMSDESEALFLDDRYSANPFGTNTARIIDVEIIEAGGGNDIVDLTSLQFTYGDVTIRGGAGDDVLWANAGDDVIEGGIGDDNIDGASGDDILIGGAGADKLYGRDGADVFAFQQMDGSVDTIGDFDIGEGDVLNITDILQGYDALTDDINDFLQLVVNGSDTEVQINADGDVGGVFETIAVMENIALATGLNDLITNGNLVADQSAI